MIDASASEGPLPVSVDEVREYCRQVEDHLTRVNGGHLVRIVGPGFELVRGWAETGIPIRIVFRGIDRKVERHQSGRATRPLRIEFCAGDVRDEYDYWRRAVGVMTGHVPNTGAPPGDDGEDAVAERRRPSLSKHLDRVLDRLGRAAGRLDLPDSLRDGLGAVMSELGEMRQGKIARGPEREQQTSRLAEIDRDVLAMVRASCPPDIVGATQRDAERDLAAYRSRLSGEAWASAVNASVDQLLRDRFGLPTIEL